MCTTFPENPNLISEFIPHRVNQGQWWCWDIHKMCNLWVFAVSQQFGLLQHILLQHIVQMQSIVFAFCHDLPQQEPNLAGNLRGCAYGTVHVSASWREKVLNVFESVRGSNRMSGVHLSAERGMMDWGEAVDAEYLPTARVIKQESCLLPNNTMRSNHL